MPENENLEFFSVDAELQKDQTFMESLAEELSAKIAERCEEAMEKYSKRHPDSSVEERAAFYNGYHAALIDSI